MLYENPVFRKIAGDIWHPGGIALTDQALEKCGFAKDALLLDLGCGAGATLALLSAKGYAAIGLDRRRNCGSAFTFILGDAVSPPFANGCFDGLVCECVLSLLPQKQQTLAQFSRILKANGKILLSDIYVRRRKIMAANPDANSCAETSCAAGAMQIKLLETMIYQAGLRILAFSDHSGALADFAARLVWHGYDISRLFASSATCTGYHAFGYGVWILSKA